MLYDPGDKETRREQWYTVPAPPRGRMREAANWCRGLNNGFGNKFYYHYTNTRWWFEHKEDAILFALKFSG